MTPQTTIEHAVGAAVPGNLDERAVLARARYFAKVGLWPAPADGFDPERWLLNFEEDEKPHAYYLLNGLLFLSEPVGLRVFSDAFQGLSRHLAARVTGAEALGRRWRSLAENALVVPVRDENPSPTDSGNYFSRVARDRLGLTVATEEQALAALCERPETPIVFVDDFVGTGSQFLRTFKRRLHPAGGEPASFEDLAINGIGTYYLCVAAACTAGLELIARRCPTVDVSAGYELPPVYSAFHEESVLWPAYLAPTAEEVIRRASLRAGIADDPGAWRGFGQLGLTLMFHHGTPDATLPLFKWQSDTWVPLRKAPA